VITLSEARARAIPLPLDDGVAQDIIDEQEAWLARRIGPLEGSRTETFHVGLGATGGKVGLRRPTSSVAVVDGGATLATDRTRLAYTRAVVGAAESSAAAAVLAHRAQRVALVAGGALLAAALAVLLIRRRVLQLDRRVLLVSIPAEKGAVLEASFADSGLALARIGRVVEGTGLALA